MSIHFNGLRRANIGVDLGNSSARIGIPVRESNCPGDESIGYIDQVRNSAQKITYLIEFIGSPGWNRNGLQH
jgi:hypothetical protein